MNRSNTGLGGYLLSEDKKALAVYDEDPHGLADALFATMMSRVAEVVPTVERAIDITSVRSVMALLEEGGKRGFASALYNLGSFWNTGEAGMLDEAEALVCYKRAIELLETQRAAEQILCLVITENEIYRPGELLAQARVNLGWLYQYGQTTPRDLSMALELYEAAAQEGEPMALWNCAVMHMNGWGGATGNVNLIVEYILRVEGKGIVEADTFARQLREANASGETALHHLLMRCMANGHDWAAEELVSILTDPTSCCYNVEVACEFARHTIERKRLRVIIKLSTLIEHRSAEIRSVARDCLERLSTLAWPSCSNFAVALLRGDGGEKDVPRAIDILESSIEAGVFPESETKPLELLADVYRGAFGVEHSNAQKELYWTKMAARKGSPVAMFNLGAFHEYGRGVLPVDPSRAAYWYRRAIKKGSVEALTNWALMGIRREIPSVSRAASIKALEQAARAGDRVAQDALDRLPSVGWTEGAGKRQV